jgi:ammonia channel protein AmtB
MDVSPLSTRVSGRVLTCRDRNWIQLPKQIAWIVASLAWTFGVTYAIMFVINLIPGCHFRATEEAEIVGMDVSLSIPSFEFTTNNRRKSS